MVVMEKVVVVVPIEASLSLYDDGRMDYASITTKTIKTGSSARCDVADSDVDGAAGGCV